MILALFACQPGGRTPESAPSVDSGLIAFVSRRDGNDEIYIINVDGTGLRQFTENYWQFPKWSPAGDKIAYRSAVRWEDPNRLYISNEDGSDTMIVPVISGVFTYSWSPDGSKIAISASRNALQPETPNYDIYVFDLLDQNVTNLTNSEPANEYHPAWQP